MELQQFEQAILKLAFETDARITTASIAYYLGIPSRQANSLLNALLEEGVLELDSDSSGNLYYRVPNHTADGDAMGDLKKLRADKHPRKDLPREPPRPSPEYFNATLEDDEAEPFSPASAAIGRVNEQPGSQSEPFDREAFGKPWAAASQPRPERESRDNWGGFDDYFEPGAGLDGTAAGAKPMASAPKESRPHWTTISTRVASPDASLDRCGSSSMVVGTQVRCEPRPLPASKPVIVSCSDAMTTTDSGRENSWFGRPADSTALVEAGDTALAPNYYIEQPEHQPGMALLLSLILCGTGQIYNGEVSKGIMMMVLCFLLWFVLLGWVVHIWSIVDAVVVAERLNRKHG